MNKEKLIYILKHPRKILMKIETLSKGKYRAPDKLVIKEQFRQCYGYELNLKNPKTYSEKLSWLKLYDRKDIYTKMVDKYEAKKYVADIIGDEYIIDTYGIYDNFDDIDFDKLPDKFVMKCTHDSGGIVICKDKSKLDIEKTSEKIEKYLNRSFYYLYREWPYKNVKPRIIIEKYLEDKKQGQLIDYKFYCFNGEPKFLYISHILENHDVDKKSFADLNYNKIDLKMGETQEFDALPEKPLNFEKMIEIAKKLSKAKAFMRVDLYEVEGKIYFSELTLYPSAALRRVTPEKYEKILGDWLEISNVEKIRRK